VFARVRHREKAKSHWIEAPPLSTNSSPEITARYLRVPQAAIYVGLASKTLYRMAEERRIPFIRKGRTLLFDRLALDKWMQASAVSPLSLWND
jgi:excisionase family DNA binding protein